MVFFVLRLLYLLTLWTVTIRKSSAQESFGGRSSSDFFPDDAVYSYDSFVIDPYHILGAPYGGFSRSAQSRLASLPLHLPEILEYERTAKEHNDALYFDTRDSSGRLFVCRLYHEDELEPESLYDSMFSAPILRRKSSESSAVTTVDQVNSEIGEVLENARVETVSTVGHDIAAKEMDASSLHATHQQSANENELGDETNTFSSISKDASSSTMDELSDSTTSAKVNVPEDRPEAHQRALLSFADVEMRLQELQSICGQIHKGWWSYEWCYGEAITQFHIDFNAETNTIQVENVLDLGHYKQRIVSLDLTHLPPNKFAEHTPELARVTDVHTDGNVCDETGEARVTNVNMICCSESVAQQHKGMLHKQGHPVTSNIAVVVDIEEDEDVLCLYNVTVCTSLLCGTLGVDDEAGSSGKSEYRVLSRSNPTENELTMVKENESIREILDRVLNMLCLQTTLGGWWTYEICYQQRIRQFHETIGTKRNSAGAKVVAKITETEHVLGLYDESKERNDIPDTEEWKLVVNATNARTGGTSGGNVWGEGSGAYYEIEYTGGDVCDHTDVTDSAIVAGSAIGTSGGVERSSSVRFYCGEMYDVAVHEDSTCHYIVQVKVPALCQHRLFRAPSAKKQVIKCLRSEDE